MYERESGNTLADGIYSSLTPLIRAADGLTLCQVCSFAKLEPSTIQNWIKRGFVPHPQRKRYGERHLARVMLINALRESLQIDRVGELMSYINGNADDTSDDIISEVGLYELFNSLVDRALESHTPPDRVGDMVREAISGSIADSSVRERMIPAMTVMVSAGVAGAYKREADRLFTELFEQDKLQKQQEENNG